MDAPGEPAWTGDATDLRPYRASARRRLRVRVEAILRTILVPLADVLRDHALVHLPPAAAARLRLVHPTWAREISSELFAVRHALAPRRLSGLFVPSVFLPFDGADTVPYASLSFIPASSNITVLSSSNGIACCFSAVDDAYFVCNPATARWASIPSPPRRPGARPAMVVLFQAEVYNFRGDYTLVCAFEPARGSGTYGFQVFTSGAGAWWAADALVSAEGLVAASGVSAGGVAWWRTSIGTAVGYNPVTGRVHLAFCPGNSDRWELGSARGRLHCVVASGGDVVMFKLDDLGGWEQVARERIANIVQSSDVSEGWEAAGWEDAADTAAPEGVQLLPFQGVEVEVVVRAGGRVVAFDMVTRRRREIEGLPPEQGEDGAAEYAAHTNTLAMVAPTVLAPEPPAD